MAQHAGETSYLRSLKRGMGKKLFYSFKEVSFRALIWWRRVIAHKIIPLPAQLFDNLENSERALKRPPPALTGVTGCRLVPDLEGLFMKADNRMNRIVCVQHPGQVNIFVAAGLVRVLAEKRHYFNHYFHKPMGTD